MKRSMLTTFDNPFDPFTQYEDWENFDVQHHYNTNQVLADVAFTSSETGPIDELESYEAAIDDICRLFPNIYTRVYES